MSSQTVQFETSNIQNILIALVVICAIVYGFIEFRKINYKLQELESMLLKHDNWSEEHPQVEHHQEEHYKDKHNHEEPIYYETDIEDQSIVEHSIDNTIVTNIINQVEEDIINQVEEDILNLDEGHNKVTEELTKEEEDISNGYMNGLFISVETTSNQPIEDPQKDRITEINEDESIYEEHTIKELKHILEEMKLSTSGNKHKLIERIISNKIKSS
jgi:hypothetical protein